MKVLFLFGFEIFVNEERFEKKVGIKGFDTFFLANELKISHGFENGFIRDGLNEKELGSDPVIPTNNKKEYLNGVDLDILF